jgi:hypothetical protein
MYDDHWPKHMRELVVKVVRDPTKDPMLRTAVRPSRMILLQHAYHWYLRVKCSEHMTWFLSNSVLIVYISNTSDDGMNPPPCARALASSYCVILSHTHDSRACRRS